MPQGLLPAEKFTRVASEPVVKLPGELWFLKRQKAGALVVQETSGRPSPSMSARLTEVTMLPAAKLTDAASVTFPDVLVFRKTMMLDPDGEPATTSSLPSPS